MSWQKDDVSSWFSDQGVAGKWRDMYDAESDRPDEHFFRLRKDFALSRITERLAPESRVLDFGCGSGPVVAGLNQKGYDCVGIDYSDDMTRHARRRLLQSGIDERRVFRGDCAKAPFPDDQFDGVVCLGVISYLKDYRPVLLEIRRILKPGGIALISFRNRFNPVASDPVLTGKWLLKRVMGRAEQDEEHLGRFLAPGVVRREIMAAGLSIQSREGIGFGPFTFNRTALVSGRTAIRMSDALTRVVKQFNAPPLFSWMTDVNVFVCEKG